MQIVHTDLLTFNFQTQVFPSLLAMETFQQVVQTLRLQQYNKGCFPKPRGVTNIPEAQGKRLLVVNRCCHSCMIEDAEDQFICIFQIQVGKRTQVVQPVHHELQFQ